MLILLGAAILVTGCATKNYVRQTVNPVDAKVDQVTARTISRDTEIWRRHKKDVSKNRGKISAMDETGHGR